MFRSFSSDAEAKAFVSTHAPRSGEVGNGGGGGTGVGASGSSGSATGGSSAPTSGAVRAGFSFLLRFDGACVGNPGPGGAGALLYGVPDGDDAASGTGSGWGANNSALDDAAGVTRGGWVSLWEGASYIGASTTNNVAEYRGLILGLAAALRVGVGRRGARLCVQGDSELIIRQVLGEYEVKAEHLKPLRAEAARLIAALRACKVDVIVSHVLRHCNAEADRLSNVGLTRGGGAGVFDFLRPDALARFGCSAPPEVIEILDDDAPVSAPAKKRSREE